MIPEHRPLEKLLNIIIQATRTSNIANHTSQPLFPILSVFHFSFLTTNTKEVLRDLSIKLIKLQPTSIKKCELVTDSTPPANYTNTETLPVFALSP